jgi:hypothetical protein
VAALLASCGGDDGSATTSPDATDAPPPDDPAPPTTTAPAPPALDGVWDATLQLTATMPPDVQLAPESQRKERTYEIEQGPCPAPGDLDAAPLDPSLPGTAQNRFESLPQASCVGEVDFTSAAYRIQHLPLGETATGYEFGWQAEVVCTDLDTGAVVPGRFNRLTVTVSFDITREADGRAVRAEGQVTESDTPDSDCPSTEPATAQRTFDLTAVGR